MSNTGKHSCPQCGEHTVRKQKSSIAKTAFRCYSCYWSGDIPNIEQKIMVRNGGKAVIPVKCEEIIKNLLAGATIQEQKVKYGVSGIKTHSAADGRQTGIVSKILRTYTAYAEITEIPCADPDFVKMKVTPDILQMVAHAIEEEETKIRNSPRLSVNFSK